uniref:Ovule protein n=1 Tax=Caenorhabditis tropicalis TaxID=1561998 RepID=A0A1I7UU95_9PELO
MSSSSSSFPHKKEMGHTHLSHQKRTKNEDEKYKCGWILSPSLHFSSFVRPSETPPPPSIQKPRPNQFVPIC